MFHGKSHWGQKITESRPESNLWLPGITTVLHLCYTHAYVRKKKLKHMSNICLPATHGTQQKTHQGRERWNEERTIQRTTKGDSGSSGSFMSLATPITVGRSSANQPGPPQLLHLTHCSFYSLSVARWLLQRGYGNLETAEPKQITSKRLI